MKSQCSSNNKGFTVVELMVAVVITVISFAGLATMEIACINGNSIASNVTTGITLAQDKMEDLMSLDINDPDLDDNNISNNANLREGVEDSTETGESSNSDDGHREKNIDAKGNPGGMYTRFWNVAEDTPIDGQKTLVVIVTWRDSMVTVSSII